MGNRTARAMRLFWRTLLDIKEGITTIMAQIDDLKAANAAEASAITEALAALKADAEQHAADVAALAAKTADNPDLSGLVSDLNGRAASISAAVAALHGSVAKPAPVATDIVTGAGSDTIATGTADTVAGAATASVAGVADSVTGSGADSVSAT